MRNVLSFNEGWTLSFPKHERESQKVNLPHTWNAIDGMDANGSYLRTTGIYSRTFLAPSQPLENGRLYLEVLAASLYPKETDNGQLPTEHEGGISTFRCDITNLCKEEENELRIEVSNEDTPSMYPASADFTFYGGLYRGVNLISVPDSHFDLDYYGGPGIKVTPKPTEDGGAIFEIETVFTNLSVYGNQTFMRLRMLAEKNLPQLRVLVPIQKFVLRCQIFSFGVWMNQTYIRYMPTWKNIMKR